MERRPVSVQDMLRARDERAARQQAFLNRHAAPLVSFTLNIAGAIKGAIAAAGIGTVVKVKQILKSQGENIRVLVTPCGRFMRMRRS